MRPRHRRANWRGDRADAWAVLKAVRDQDPPLGRHRTLSHLYGHPLATVDMPYDRGHGMRPFEPGVAWHV